MKSLLRTPRDLLRRRHVRDGRIDRVIHVAASPYKTGTTSLGHALVALGVGTAQMPYRPQILKDHKAAIRRYNRAAETAESWAAFEAEHGAAALADLAGFTRAVSAWDVFPDAPMGHTHLHPFLRKLIAPRAKFIWLNRDIPDWVASVRKWEEGHPDLYKARAADWASDPKRRRRGLRRAWERRHARFRRLAEAFPEDCLELSLDDLATMDPLCAFYGLPATGQPFPRRNVSRDEDRARARAEAAAGLDADPAVPAPETDPVPAETAASAPVAAPGPAPDPAPAPAAGTPAGTPAPAPRAGPGGYGLSGVIRGRDLVVTLTAPPGLPPALTLDLLAPDGAAPRRLPCPLVPRADDPGVWEGRVPLGAELDGEAPLAGIVPDLEGETPDLSDWQAATLLVPDRATYNRIMRYAFERISDPETLMWQSLITARADQVETRIRMTSFVVFCYRAIDLGRRDLLRARMPLFDTFAAEFDAVAQFTTGSVREVGEQVILSLLSVRWHAEIALDRPAEAIATLRTILARGRNNPQYHALPFATNYANAAVLLAYLHFRHQVPCAGVHPGRDFYDQFRHIMTSLPDDQIPPYNHLREFVPVSDKMSLAADLEFLMRDEVRQRLADGSANQHERRRQDFAAGAYDAARIFRMTSRIAEGDAFKAAFERFCDTAVPRD